MDQPVICLESQVDRCRAPARVVQKHRVAALAVHLQRNGAGFSRDAGAGAFQLRESIEPDALVRIARDDFDGLLRAQVEIDDQ